MAKVPEERACHSRHSLTVHTRHNRTQFRTLFGKSAVLLLAPMDIEKRFILNLINRKLNLTSCTRARNSQTDNPASPRTLRNLYSRSNRNCLAVATLWRRNKQIRVSVRATKATKAMLGVKYAKAWQQAVCSTSPSRISFIGVSGCPSNPCRLHSDQIGLASAR